MNSKEYYTKSEKISKKKNKLEYKIPLSDLNSYNFVKIIVDLNKRFGNITVERFIEGIKDIDIKETLMEYKKLEDEMDTLREAYYASLPTETDPQTIEAGQKEEKCF